MPTPAINHPQMPGDFTGSFSELLAQLVQTYTWERAAQFMSECSGKISQVQGYLRALEDEATPPQEQAALLQNMAQASGEYYAFLARVPKDVCRFLVMMSGVSPEEVEQMLETEPLVKGELRELASVAPVIQSVRPKNYVMPIDPISNKLAHLREFNQIVVSRKRNLTIQTAVSIDCPENMKIIGDFNLTNYEKSIINGVVSILESGTSSFTIPMLYHAMTGKENPSLDDGLLEDIKRKLDVMRTLTINIDLTQELKAHMIDPQMGEGLESFTIEGYLLPLNKYTGVVNGKRSEMYQIISTPPLHSYAKLKKQITSVPIDLLKAPLNNNSTTIPLKTYLLTRIEGMKNENNHLTRDTIRFSSIYRELGAVDADKKRKKRIRDYTQVILDYFVEMGYITKYEIIKEGRTITGVRLWWEEKQP